MFRWFVLLSKFVCATRQLLCQPGPDSCVRGQTVRTSASDAFHVTRLIGKHVAAAAARFKPNNQPQFVHCISIKLANYFSFMYNFPI